MSEVILKLEDVNKNFETADGRKLRACNNIDLELRKGEILGIVGESGCGKSTLVRLIIQLEKISSGKILYRGRNLAELSKREQRENRKDIQMIFQDAGGAFNPRMKIKEIITEPLLNFKLLKKGEIERKATELLEMVELSAEYLEMYPHNLSGGQLQRVGIARAISLEPEILICDEATSALDTSVQKSIVELLKRIQKNKDMSIIFICHDLALVQGIADEIVVMYLGFIVEKMRNKNLKLEAKHPYTKALIGSILTLDRAEKLEVLKGDIPSPLSITNGCPFTKRCKFAMKECELENPQLRELSSEHQVRCYYLDSNTN